MSPDCGRGGGTLGGGRKPRYCRQRLDHVKSLFVLNDTEDYVKTLTHAQKTKPHLGPLPSLLPPPFPFKPSPTPLPASSSSCMVL